jgi:hypothetical protein
MLKNVTRANLLAVGAILVFAATLNGQTGLAQYRGFTLGSSVAAVSSLTGVAVSNAKVVHQRPALVQDVEWRLSQWVSGASLAAGDPVERMLFSFYNDQLYRIVVDYGSERTEGLTSADLIDAISAVYGAPTKNTPAAARAPSVLEANSGVLVARWSDATYAAGLYRISSYRDTFRLVVTSSALENLAQKAATQSMVLDEKEAPQREIARAKKEQDDKRAAAEKARTANKGGFRP